MAETLDPKEAKTLSDILALVLDEQPGSAASALRKLRERAEGDRTTAGALKNMFVRLAGATAAPPDAATRAIAEVAGLRETVAVQAASIRELHQQVRNARAELAAAGEAHDRLVDSRAGRRVALFLGLGCGAVLSSAAAGFLGWRLASSEPAHRPADVAPPAALPKGAVVIVPPIRDPADTAPGPDYPADAKARGEEGTVALVLHIDADGRVSGIGVAQSAGANLDVAAQQAVREWRFKPETRDGLAVASQLMMRFSFVLKRP